MERNEILTISQEYLAEYLNCTVQELNKDELIFAANDKKDYPFLEICTMGQSTIVSASHSLIDKLRNLLSNKSRDEIFECPFVYGQSIYYIPDCKKLKKKALNPEIEYELLQDKEIQKLRGIKGFENSLVFDENGNTSTCIVLCASKDNEIAALASASKESDKMWELGVDVKPMYRKKGLATILVTNLACEILEQGKVPFYCASTTNVGSQAVAYRSGFLPCWVSTYRNILDGSSVYQSILEKITL